MESIQLLTTTCRRFVERGMGMNWDHLRFYIRRQHPTDIITPDEIAATLVFLLDVYEGREEYEVCQLIHTILKQLYENTNGKAY
jgi:hypothetical protein